MSTSVSTPGSSQLTRRVPVQSRNTRRHVVPVDVYILVINEGVAVVIHPVARGVVGGKWRLPPEDHRYRPGLPAWHSSWLGVFVVSQEPIAARRSGRVHTHHQRRYRHSRHPLRRTWHRRPPHLPVASPQVSTSDPATGTPARSYSALFVVSQAPVATRRRCRPHTHRQRRCRSRHPPRRRWRRRAESPSVPSLITGIVSRAPAWHSQLTRRCSSSRRLADRRRSSPSTTYTHRRPRCRSRHRPRRRWHRPGPRRTTRVPGLTTRALGTPSSQLLGVFVVSVHTPSPHVPSTTIRQSSSKVSSQSSSMPSHVDIVGGQWRPRPDGSQVSTKDHRQALQLTRRVRRLVHTPSPQAVAVDYILIINARSRRSRHPPRRTWHHPGPRRKAGCTGILTQRLHSPGTPADSACSSFRRNPSPHVPSTVGILIINEDAVAIVVDSVARGIVGGKWQSPACGSQVSTRAPSTAATRQCGRRCRCILRRRTSFRRG